MEFYLRTLASIQPSGTGARRLSPPAAPSLQSRLGVSAGAWRPRAVGYSVPDQFSFFSRFLDLRSLKRLMRASVPGSRAVGSGFTADLTMAPGINGIKIYENVLKIYLTGDGHKAFEI